MEKTTTTKKTHEQMLLKTEFGDGNGPRMIGNTTLQGFLFGVWKGHTALVHVES